MLCSFWVIHCTWASSDPFQSSVSGCFQEFSFNGELWLCFPFYSVFFFCCRGTLIVELAKRTKQYKGANEDKGPILQSAEHVLRCLLPLTPVDSYSACKEGELKECVYVHVHGIKEPYLTYLWVIAKCFKSRQQSDALGYERCLTQKKKRNIAALVLILLMW